MVPRAGGPAPGGVGEVPADLREGEFETRYAQVVLRAECLREAEELAVLAAQRHAGLPESDERPGTRTSTRRRGPPPPPFVVFADRMTEEQFEEHGRRRGGGRRRGSWPRCGRCGGRTDGGGEPGSGKLGRGRSLLEVGNPQA